MSTAIPEEIAVQYPHINLAQIYAALAYYHANRDEIDRELETEAAEFLSLTNESATKPRMWKNHNTQRCGNTFNVVKIDTNKAGPYDETMNV